jgi:hypothetical protein
VSRVPWDVIYVILAVSLIAIGMVLIVHGYPYLQNQVHEELPPVVQNVFSNKLNTWFTITSSTMDAYAANNPIDIQIQTGMLDLDEIRQIQLTFIGAQKAVITKEPTLPELPPSNASREEYDQYWEAMEKYHEDSQKYWEEYRTAISSNIFFLNSLESYDKLLQREKEINSFTGQNRTLPKFSRFQGTIQNLTYTTGGTFDIGVTLKKRDGGVVGYGMSDLSYVIDDVISISPPEVLKQIENNNIMTGLGYIGIGVAPLVAGLVGILEIFKHFAFS